MSTEYILGAIAAAILAGGYLAVKIADRIQLAKARRASKEWLIANPPGPPLTPAERQAFEAWVESETLPAVRLTPAYAPVAAGGTRIGGPAWLAEGEDWPRDREGRDMEFIAQVDFDALPAIPDFPESGLLQFFISQDDLFGMDLDQPDHCDVRLIWRPEPGAGRLVAPPPLDPKTGMSPLSKNAREKGVSFTGTADAMLPTAIDWRVDAKLDRSIDADDLCEALDDRGSEFGNVHQVGGHPAFTQWDYRSAERFADVDRTLLRLTSDDVVQWGDMGEASFMIRREDLLARRFDRAIFWWDCS